MDKVGTYEITEQFSQGTFSTLYVCRSENEPDREFILKRFQPLLPEIEEDLWRRYNKDLLDTASVQRQIFTMGSNYWAPVLEIGEDQNRSYYVTERYNSSLQRIFQADVRLSAENIYVVLDSVLSGLKDLKNTLHRPHGNLKPGNILIAGNTSRPVSRAVLCDPLPDSRITTQSESLDIQKVGQFLYQMVMLREASRRQDWKAPNTEEWRIFGKKSLQWLEFCNLLLNAPHLPESLTIEFCLEKLQSLKSPKRKTLQLTSWAVGIILLIIVAAFIVNLVRPKPADQVTWDAYIRDYLVWSGPFHDALAAYFQADPSRQSVWEGAGLGALAKGYPNLDYPYRFLKGQGEDVDYLKAHPQDPWPAFAEFDPKPRAAELERARETSEAILALLDLGSEKAWSYLKDLKIPEAQFQARREDLASLLEGVNPAASCTEAAGCGRVIRRIERIIELHPSFVVLQGQLDGLWESVKRAGPQGHGEAVRSFLARLYRDLEWPGLGDPEAPAEPVRSELDRLGNRIDSLAHTYRLAKEAVDTDSGNRAEVDRILSGLLGQLKRSQAPGEEFCRVEQAEIEELIITLEKYRASLDRASYAIPRFQQLWGEWKGRSLEEAGKGRQSLVRQYREVFPRIEKSFREGIEAFEAVRSLPLFPGVSWQDKHRDFYKRSYRAALTGLAGELRGIACDQWAETLDSLRRQKREDLQSTAEKLGDLCRLEAGLAACYLLEEPLPGTTETPAFLEEKFSASSGFRSEEGFRDVFALVKALREIKAMSSAPLFLRIQEPEDPPPPAVIRYARWIRLEELSPETRQAYLAEYQAIKKILPDGRRQELEGRVEQRAREVLLAYHKGRLEALAGELKQLWDAIRSGAGDFSVFGEFADASQKKVPEVTTQVEEIKSKWERGTPLEDPFREVYAVFESQKEMAGRVRDFLGTAEWRDKEDRYNKPLFIKEKLSEAEVFFDSGVDLLRRYRMYEKKPEIFAEINGYLVEIHTLLGSESGPEVEEAKRLVEDVEKELAEKWRAKAVLAYQEEIAKAVRNPDGPLWRQLKLAEDKLTPPWCRALKLEGGQVVFKDAEFAGLFEPVLLEGEEDAPIAQKSWRPVGSGQWPQLKNRGDVASPLQGIFFGVFEKAKLCWPRYIRSTRDDTVVLRYIPAEGAAPHFYLAIRETAYEQYVKFLRVKFEGNWDRLKVRELMEETPPFYLSQGSVSWWTGPKPINRFEIGNPVLSAGRDGSGDTLASWPVVWVKIRGAQAYASWLGEGSSLVRLPTAAEHRQANAFILQDSNRDFHFAEEKDLQKAWENYSLYVQSKTGSPKAQPYPSIIFKNVKNITGQWDSTANEPIYFIFPRKTTVGRGSMGIHDLQGNVWEWCMEGNQHVLCGYSSLTPQDYQSKADSYMLQGEGRSGDYEYRVQESCDVGFRIAVSILSEKE